MVGSLLYLNGNQAQSSKSFRKKPKAKKNPKSSIVGKIINKNHGYAIRSSKNYITLNL